MTGETKEVATCQVCWALVPRTLMTFHRDWHDGLALTVAPAVESPDVPGLTAVESRRLAC